MQWMKSTPPSYPPQKAKDPLIAARAADLRDVRNRVLQILRRKKQSPSLRENVIVVAHDLLPSDTAMDRNRVMGIITEVGGIPRIQPLLPSYKIPALLGVADAEIMRNGDNVIMDALAGKVLLEPEKHQEYQESWLNILKKNAKPANTLIRFRWSPVENAIVSVSMSAVQTGRKLQICRS